MDKQTKQQVFIKIESCENGYTATTRVEKVGDALYPYKPQTVCVYHSLAEAMRQVNNALSGCDMGVVYRAPKSLDFDEAERNMDEHCKRILKSEQC